MMNTFYINDKKFDVSTNVLDSLQISSFPSNYSVSFEKFNASFSKHDVVLIDKNVKRIYDIHHDKLIEIDATEENKCIETALRVCEDLLKFEFTKSNKLIVIGGGIVQDIGAFVAKMFKRGINWIYYPTTLLSQCDSCIGGKTALNFKDYKNQLALFSAPEKVIIDDQFLNTLSKSDIVSGYGEIVKLFLIGGEYYTNNIHNWDLKTCIFHSLSIKKAVIDYDEFEMFERKSLNYGHSFGHVIEPLVNYEIPHGEAVLLGIEIINKLFTNSKYISDLISSYTSLDKIKNRFDIDRLLSSLKTDKKVLGNKITLVVVEKPGVTKFLEQTIDQDFKQRVHEVLID
jgi:3-dehydroquinate synthase